MKSVIICPQQNWLSIDWKSIVEYRDLLFLFVRRDFLSRYKQTILGPLWFIIQPILMTLMFTVVFGKVAQIPTGGTPHLLFYLSGLMMWNYCSQVFVLSSTTFKDNAHIFQKVYFPRLITPLSVSISNFFTFCIQFATFLSFLAYYHFGSIGNFQANLQWQSLLLPLLVIQTALIGLGIGLWMSVLTAKYRDLSHLIPFLTQLWLYATPVIYPLAQVPDKYAWILKLNPMCAVVEIIRKGFLNTGGVTASEYSVSIAITLVMLVSALLLFQRIERTFVDTL